MARLLLLFGLGFLAANVVGLATQILYWVRRRSTLLTWPGARPPFYQLQIGIGIALAVLLAYDLLLRPGALEQVFGVGMMCVYYAGVVPMNARIARGFYRDGIWSDRRFVRYRSIGAISWREEAEPVLILAARSGPKASRLVVPPSFFGASRRLLRDLIARHDIQLGETGLRLGLRDEREDA